MTKILKYLKTNVTPYVYFNAEEGYFRIEGVSTTRDDEFFFAFYIPIIDFLEDYKKIALPISTFYFDLEYLDERSNNFYFDIFGKISELQEFTQCNINWYFSDDEQEDLGIDFSEHFTDLSFKFIKSS